MRRRRKEKATRGAWQKNQFYLFTLFVETKAALHCLKEAKRD
jgi:hypothetical protein